MNRGCVFASRDLARCGTLQKCGQAAAAAAETERQEHCPRCVPSFPAMRRNPRRKFANLQRARRGCRVTQRAHGRARRGSPSPGCRACPGRLSRRAGRRSWWARARPGRARRPRRALGCRSRRSRLESGGALSARVPFSSRLLPRILPRWHHYLFPAAAPSDSSRWSRSGTQALPGTRRRSLPLRQSLHGAVQTFREVLRGARREGAEEMFSPSGCTPLPLCHRFISRGCLVDKALLVHRTPPPPPLALNG
nr:uncharacterized protein LOC105875936 [Microcebus murinus]